MIKKIAIGLSVILAGIWAGCSFSGDVPTVFDTNVTLHRSNSRNVMEGSVNFVAIRPLVNGLNSAGINPTDINFSTIKFFPQNALPSRYTDLPANVRVYIKSIVQEADIFDESLYVPFLEGNEDIGDMQTCSFNMIPTGLAELTNLFTDMMSSAPTIQQMDLYLCVELTTPGEEFDMENINFSLVFNATVPFTAKVP